VPSPLTSLTTQDDGNLVTSGHAMTLRPSSRSSMFSNATTTTDDAAAPPDATDAADSDQCIPTRRLMTAPARGSGGRAAGALTQRRGRTNELSTTTVNRTAELKRCIGGYDSVENLRHLNRLHTNRHWRNQWGDGTTPPLHHFLVNVNREQGGLSGNNRSSGNNDGGWASQTMPVIHRMSGSSNSSRLEFDFMNGNAETKSARKETYVRAVMSRLPKYDT
jgi:hypothetical protein